LLGIEDLKWNKSIQRIGRWTTDFNSIRQNLNARL
jgi:hypothetical protein